VTGRRTSTPSSSNTVCSGLDGGATDERAGLTGVTCGRDRATSGTHQAGAVHQPQDRQGPRPDDPAVAAVAGGSGDRVSRKGAKPRSQRTKPAAASEDDRATVPLFRWRFRWGDRFTDEKGEWEVARVFLPPPRVLRRVKRVESPYFAMASQAGGCSPRLAPLLHCE
jgi:hypothetical protein